MLQYVDGSFEKMKSYNEYVAKYLDEFSLVIIEKNYYQRLMVLVEEIVKAKGYEDHHKSDNISEKKRFMTGLLGEAALEQILGLKIVDWSVGYSALYNRPDIFDYGVGIKTVEEGKFPVIFKYNKYPQIICVRKVFSRAVYVCGLATVDVLNSYQDDSLILSPDLRRRGTKTGFFGFDKLIPVKSLDDLKKIIK